MIESSNSVLLKKLNGALSCDSCVERGWGKRGGRRSPARVMVV